jgi:putative ATPase
MKELGYHEGYQYAHDAPEAYIPQEYLPERLRGTEFYEPGPFGFEKDIAKRLSWWKQRAAEMAETQRPQQGTSAGTDDEKATSKGKEE